MEVILGGLFIPVILLFVVLMIGSLIFELFWLVLDAITGWL